MNDDVAKYVSSCASCKREKVRRHSPDIPAGLMDAPREPFELISIDFVGPMDPKSEDFKYILVVVDHFSRWAVTIPTLSQDAVVVAQSLMDEVYSKFGVPKRILSDRGTPFVSQLVKQLHDKLKVKSLLTSAYHPETNGMVERLNGTLKSALFALREEYGEQWVQVLQAATFAYNTSRSEATGYTPYFAVFGREATTAGDILAATVDTADRDVGVPMDAYVQFTLGNLELCHNFIRSTFASKREAHLKDQLKGRRVPIFAVGDRVMVQDPTAASAAKAGRGGHVAPWIGPCTIVTDRPSVTVSLSLPLR